MMDRISLADELEKNEFLFVIESKILLFRFRLFFCLAALLVTVLADVDPESPAFVLQMKNNNERYQIKSLLFNSFFSFWYSFTKC
jgi:hypothetical protein